MELPSLKHNPDRFTDRALKVIRVARELAAASGQPLITPEHVLFAMAEVEPGPGRVTLERMGFDFGQLSELHVRTEDIVRGTAGAPAASPATVRLIGDSKAVALTLKHNYVGTEHLVLAMLTCESCPAGNFLKSKGIGVESFKMALRSMLAGDGALP